MKVCKVFLLFLISMNVFANMGHRGGCESKIYHDTMELPENSIICLEAGLMGLDGHEPLQHDEDFKYLEFDIRETKDNELVVYHGGSDGRVFYKKKKFRKSHATAQYDDYNKIVYESFNTGIDWDDVKVKDLTLAEITQIRISEEHMQYIPSLKEYLNAAIEFKLTRPLMAELKEIHSKLARERLLELVKNYKTQYADKEKIKLVNSPDKEFERQTVGFMARKTKAKKIMGKEGSDTFDDWCRSFREYGFPGIYKTTKSKSNYCD